MCSWIESVNEIVHPCLALDVDIIFLLTAENMRRLLPAKELNYRSHVYGFN